MTYVSIREILDGKVTDKEVAIRGWVHRKREGKEMIFLVMRDATGIIQCTVKRTSKAWDQGSKITIESSATLKGKVKEDARAPGGYEIQTENIDIVGLADTPFPITKGRDRTGKKGEEDSEDFLRNIRHLWLRSREMTLIMKVRGQVLKFVDEFFEDRKFTQVSPPMFITSACEGGSTLFGLKYFDQSMYLTQSAQLYLEILIYSLEKVYCIAPSFRAEKSRTIRHLSEYWHIEAEQAFADMNDLIRLEEDLLTYVCKRTLETCKREFEELGADVKKLQLVKPTFPRITYTEAVEKLRTKGCRTKWGDDLGYEEEKTLADDFGKPFFVYDYPKQIKAFYCKTYRDRPDIAMSTDMLVPRIGELSTGGAREDDKDQLIQRIKEQGLNEKDYDWYIDLRRYGTVPHMGFGMGLERLLTWMLDLENIIDSIPFPRTTRRFYP